MIFSFESLAKLIFGENTPLGVTSNFGLILAQHSHFRRLGHALAIFSPPIHPTLHSTIVPFSRISPEKHSHADNKYFFRHLQLESTNTIYSTAFVRHVVEKHIACVWKNVSTWQKYRWCDLIISSEYIVRSLWIFMKFTASCVSGASADKSSSSSTYSPFLMDNSMESLHEQQISLRDIDCLHELNTIFTF